MILLPSQYRYNNKRRRRRNATNGGSILFLSLSVLLCVIDASSQEDQMAEGQHDHRRLKKKSPKHFSFNNLVDGFDGDDTYFVSYNEKKKEKTGNLGKSEKKKCKGKAGSKSSKKKKKTSLSTSKNMSKSEVYEDCTSEPTMLTTLAPTISPTIEPTDIPTVQLSPSTTPTTVGDRDDAGMDDDDEDEESSSEKGKKSKKEKSKKEKKEKTKMRVEIVPDVTSTVSTRSRESSDFKGKVTPKFRAEIPISIPFPSNAPVQEPSNYSISVRSKDTAAISPTEVLSGMPSSRPTTMSSIEPLLEVDLTIHSSALTVIPTDSFTEFPSTPPVFDESSLGMESDTRNSEELQVSPSPVRVESSPFYLTFSLHPVAHNPSYSAMEEAIKVSTIFLDKYVNTTFSLIDASVFWGTITAPVSFSADFRSIELMTMIEFADSSDFIPGTEDIDMLWEIAFVEPSVSALLMLLKELPPDNPFQQTVSVIRTAGHLELNQVAPPSTTSSSNSSIRGSVVGACAAAFVVAAFAAVYRTRRKRHQFTKLGNKNTHADVTTANESSVGAPSLIEQLEDDSNEINTIEFYGEDDDDTGQSHKGSLFESPFLQGELPGSFREV